MFNDEMNYNLIEKNAEFQREMHKKYVDSVGEKRYLSVQDLILATNQIRLHFFDVNNYSGFTTAKTNVKPNEIAKALLIITKLEIFEYDKLYPFEIVPFFNLTLLKEQLEELANQITKV